MTLTTNDPAGPCGAVSDNITITIGAPLASATLTGTGDACFGATSSVKSVITGGAPPYTINYTINGVAQAPVTPYTSGNNFSIGALPVGTYIYQITSVTDPCGNTVPPAGLPAAYTIHINGIPDLALLDKSICSDVASGITLSIANPGPTITGLTYNINSITNNGLTASAGGPVTGNGKPANEIVNDAWTNTSGANVNVIYAIVPVSSQGCSGVQENVTLTVNSEPVGVAASPAICNGAVLNYDLQNNVNTLGNNQPSTFSWVAKAAMRECHRIKYCIAKAGSIINDLLTNNTNVVQVVVYTVTPTGTNLCTGNNFMVSVTINPMPNILNFTPSICSGGSFTTTPVNGVDGLVPVGVTYSWAVPAVTGGITGGALGAGATSITGTLSNPTNTVQTATYFVVPTFAGCTGGTFFVTVTVNPKPSITPMASPVCSGSAFTITPANGANGIVPAGTLYSWAAPAGAGFTGGAAGAGAANISGTLTNTTSAAVTATYTVTPTSSVALGSCVGATFTVTVTVNPKPAIGNMSATVCSATGFTVTPVDVTNGIVPAGTLYSWAAPAGAGFTGGAAGAGAANISGTLTNTTNAAVTATYQ